MKNYAENAQDLDKCTGRKRQEGFNICQTLLPDSLDAWVECYLRLAVSGVPSDDLPLEEQARLLTRLQP
jgi:hypothetical protein